MTMSLFIRLLLIRESLALVTVYPYSIGTTSATHDTELGRDI